MPRGGKLHVMSAPDAATTAPGARAVRLRIARAANDNQRIHAPWRRVVAASTAVLFAASLILVGLVCIANAGEPLETFVTRT